MKKNHCLSLLMLCIVFTFSEIYAQNIDLSKFQLDWSEEFNNPNNFKDLGAENSVSKKFGPNWIAQHAVEPNRFVSCSRWIENLEVKDGALRITVKTQVRGNQSSLEFPQNFTAGSVWTRKKFKYGYFEVRMQYAGATGTNNSFWLWQKTGNIGNLKKFEVDINEGHYPNEINTNIHNFSDQSPDGTFPDNPQPKIVNTTATSNLGNTLHTYGLLWTASQYKFYYDRKLIRTLPNPNNINNAETNILLSLATLRFNIAGPVNPSQINNKVMKVDYVRHYKSKSNKNTGGDKAIQEKKDGIKENVIFYPNPVRDVLSIQNNLASDLNVNSRAIIYNISGTVLINEKISSGNNDLQVSQLDSGIYIVKIINEDQVIIKKIVKE